MRRFRAAAPRTTLLTLCLWVLGCANDGVRPCDLWTAEAVVSGRVTDASGAGIANATIDVQIAIYGSCEEATDWARSAQVTTDASGNYAAPLGLGNANGLRCVRVTAQATGTVGFGAVEFVGGCYETRPPGQLQVDLVIL